MLPQAIAQEIERLYHEQSDKSDELLNLEVAEIEHFNEHRNDFTSDKQCEMAWKHSTKGIEHHKVKSRLISIKQQLSSLKALLRNAEAIARGLY